TSGLVDQLQEIVGVHEAQVQRDWPHGLQITIVPRVPVAAVADDEQFVVLDGEGVELDRSQEEPEDLPLVDVPLGEEDTAASLTAVLEVLGALPDELLTEVAAASAPSPNQVRLELPDGVEVFWGSSAENERKVQVLQTLRQGPATPGGRRRARHRRRCRGGTRERHLASSGPENDITRSLRWRVRVERSNRAPNERDRRGGTADLPGGHQGGRHRRRRRERRQP